MSRSELTPMKVGDWAASELPVVPVLPAPGPLAVAPAAPEPEQSPLAKLPVDPFRLLAGLRKRRWWILAGLVLGLCAGLALGVKMATTRYQVSVQLIKRDTPSSFRVGEAGEAFRPKQFAAGTLVGAAAAPTVIHRVAAKSGGKASAGEIQGGIEVKEQRATDFVFLTFSNRDSAATTVELANLWAAEAVQFTRELQGQESREMRQFLQQQVDATDRDLRKLGDQILEFTKRENLVDANKQIDAYLRAFSDIDLKYETARIDLDTIDFKIASAEKELRRQSPVADKLRAAQLELEGLRSRYTDQNPLVVEKLEAVHALETQIKTDGANPAADPASFAGTFLGNTLYLELVRLQAEKKSLLQQKEALEKLRVDAKERLEAIPEKAAAFTALGLRRQALETAHNLLYSRLREAQLFEENSPGYYRIFAPATADRVITHGKPMKAAIFTIAGGLGCCLAAILAALVMELLDPVLKTPAEAAKAYRRPALAVLPAADLDPAVGADIWAQWIGAERSAGTPRIIWSPSPGPEEDAFWLAMFERAAQLLPALRVIDCGTPALPVPEDGAIHIEQVNLEAFSIASARELIARLRDGSRRQEIWIRITGSMHEPLTTIARGGRPPLVLVRLHADETEFWRKQGELLAKTVGPAAGVIAVGELPWAKWK